MFFPILRHSSMSARPQAAPKKSIKSDRSTPSVLRKMSDAFPKLGCRSVRLCASGTNICTLRYPLNYVIMLSPSLFYSGSPLFPHTRKVVRKHAPLLHKAESPLCLNIMHILIPTLIYRITQYNGKINPRKCIFLHNLCKRKIAFN